MERKRFGRKIDGEPALDQTRILVKVLNDLRADRTQLLSPANILRAQDILIELNRTNPEPEGLIAEYAPMLTGALASPDETNIDPPYVDTRPLIINTHIVIQLKPEARDMLDANFSEAEPIDARRYQLFSDFVAEVKVA